MGSSKKGERLEARDQRPETREGVILTNEVRKNLTQLYRCFDALRMTISSFNTSI